MKNIYLIICSIFLFTRCSEEVVVNYTDDDVPGKVTVVSVENEAGKSRINLDMPDSKSLLFVEAVYEDKGKTIVAKASAFNSFIELEGFSEAKDFQVKLYSVSRGMNKSEPVEVIVSPTNPPYKKTFEKLDVEADFGGFNLNFENTEMASLAVFVDKYNAAVAEWESLDAFYYQDPERTIYVRNQVGRDLKYRVRVRDKFLNYSDYKEFTVTPWVESEMDYSKFRGYPLPNDPQLFLNSQQHDYLWNQIYFTGTSTTSGTWIGSITAHQIAGSSEYMITFDLGKEAKLTRLILYQRGIDGSTGVPLYQTFNLKEFEIYGSNDPNPDGSWSSWTKILKGEIVKPVGSTAEILEIAKRGESFNFDKNTPAFRYLRLKNVRTFGNPLPARFVLAGIRLFENSNY